MVEVLEAKANPFRGIVPLPAALPENPDLFRQQLHHSLQTWKTEGYLVVWLEISIVRAALIPVAVEAGFTFHHSAEDYLMLTHRLVPDAFVPGYATHYIGAGGVVLNDNRELLVVSEKYRSRRGPSYKLPGGALHAGEHLVEGVIREVFEETGVRARFEALACFRHWHGYRYGKSDIYFVCRLKAVSRQIAMQVDEIAECLWMPVDAFLSHTDVHTFNKEIVRAALENPGLAPSLIDGYADDGTREFFMPKFS
jgi:8-oxo-dGTP pyrophosphatase MutT (NUDIX family)